jgi:NADPH:quinone reductase-like Zn-dependent oxidoreductase
MNRAISQHSLAPVVDRVFNFEQSGEAFDYMEQRAHFGKIVVRV